MLHVLLESKEWQFFEVYKNHFAYIIRYFKVGIRLSCVFLSAQFQIWHRLSLKGYKLHIHYLPIVLEIARIVIHHNSNKGDVQWYQCYHRINIKGYKQCPICIDYYCMGKFCSTAYSENFEVLLLWQIFESYIFHWNRYRGEKRKF